MKEHLQDDSFEKFMRNKLNEFDGEPNDNMWDRVENVIPPAPKPMLFRIMKPSVIAASMVLAIATFAMVYQYNSTQNLNQQIIEANDKIKQLENKIDQNSVEKTAQLEEVNKNETVEIVTYKDENQEKNDAVHQNNKNEFSNLNTNKKLNLNQPNIVFDSKKSNNSSFIPKEKQNNQPTKNASSDFKKERKTPMANKADENIFVKNDENKESQNQLNSNQINKTSIANDNKLDHQLNDNLNSKKEDIALTEPVLLDRIKNNQITNHTNFEITEQPTMEKPKFKPRLLVGTFVHSFQTRPEFKERPGPPPLGGNPFKNHRVKPSTGLAIGAKIGVQLNKKWSIHSGLAFQKEQVEMKLVDKRDYRKERENDIGNNQEGYQANYMTQSPFGEIGIDGQFTKDKDTDIENRPFDIEIDGEHKLTSVNIPLYAQVQDQKGRFVYGLKAGVYGRKIINSSFDAKEITSSISELKSSEVTITEQPDVNSKWTADFLGGLVLGYQHNSNLMVSVEPTALMSLGNKHENQYGGTKMKTFGSQLAVQYTF